jgi:hypothetical protein
MISGGLGEAVDLILADPVPAAQPRCRPARLGRSAIETTVPAGLASFIGARSMAVDRRT